MEAAAEAEEASDLFRHLILGHTNFRHQNIGSAGHGFATIIKTAMPYDYDAAEELQFTFARVLAALPGVSTAVSGEFAVPVASQPVR